MQILIHEEQSLFVVKKCESTQNGFWRGQIILLDFPKDTFLASN